MKPPPTVDSVPGALAAPAPRQVIEAVAEHWQIPAQVLRGSNRTPRVSRVRDAAIYLVRDLCRLSYPEIGRLFGRDHTTVLAACRRAAVLVAEGNSSFRDDLVAVRKRVAAGPLVKVPVAPQTPAAELAEIEAEMDALLRRVARLREQLRH